MGNMTHQKQAALNKELGSLQPLVERLAELQHTQNELQDLAVLADSPEPDMQQMAAEERAVLETKVNPPAMSMCPSLSEVLLSMEEC